MNRVISENLWSNKTMSVQEIRHFNIFRITLDVQCVIMQNVLIFE